MRASLAGRRNEVTLPQQRMHIDHENPDEELVKCVVVGDSGVGKTKLVCTRACGATYTLPGLMQIHVPTVWAIDHYATDVEIFNRSRALIDGVNVSLRLWDTFGYHDKDRRFAYGRASVVLLCFSLVRPTSLKNAKTIWYPEIARFCPGVPVILVGCQADLRYLYTCTSFTRLDKGPFFRQILESDLIYPDVGRAVAESIGAAAYYETSVLTGVGVKATFDNAIRAALLKRAACSLMQNFKHVRQPLPQAPCLPPKPDPPLEIAPTAGPCAAVDNDLSRLLAEGRFADVVFVCQDERFLCHRIVIAAGCPSMRDLFCIARANTRTDNQTGNSKKSCMEFMSHSLKVNQDGGPQGNWSNGVFTAFGYDIDEVCRLEDRGRFLVVVDSDVSSSAFACLLRFLYSGVASGSPQAVIGAKSLAERLHILDLAEQCAGALAAAGGQAAVIVSGASIKYLTERAQFLKQFALVDRLYTDVLLQLSDGQLEAHRSVLSARCDVMNAMFHGSFKESASHVVYFKEVSTSTCSALIEILYSGRCRELKPCGYVELLALANQLCLPRVVSYVEKACVQKLTELDTLGLDITSLALSIMEVAQLHNAHLLAEWCHHHISVNYLYCFRHHSQELNELSSDRRKKLTHDRWPPLWFLRETDVYLKLVRNSRKESAIRMRCEEHTDVLLAAGCLCFSTKIKQVQDIMEDADFDREV